MSSRPQTIKLQDTPSQLPIIPPKAPKSPADSVWRGRELHTSGLKLLRPLVPQLT